MKQKSDVSRKAVKRRKSDASNGDADVKINSNDPTAHSKDTKTVIQEGITKSPGQSEKEAKKALKKLKRRKSGDSGSAQAEPSSSTPSKTSADAPIPVPVNEKENKDLKDIDLQPDENAITTDADVKKKLSKSSSKKSKKRRLSDVNDSASGEQGENEIESNLTDLAEKKKTKKDKDSRKSKKRRISTEKISEVETVTENMANDSNEDGGQKKMKKRLSKLVTSNDTTTPLADTKMKNDTTPVKEEKSSSGKKAKKSKMLINLAPSEIDVQSKSNGNNNGKKVDDEMGIANEKNNSSKKSKKKRTSLKVSDIAVKKENIEEEDVKNNTETEINQKEIPSSSKKDMQPNSNGNCSPEKIVEEMDVVKEKKDSAKRSKKKRASYMKSSATAEKTENTDDVGTKIIAEKETNHKEKDGTQNSNSKDDVSILESGQIAEFDSSVQSPGTTNPWATNGNENIEQSNNAPQSGDKRTRRQSGGSQPGTPFKRVREDNVQFLDDKLRDNSFYSKNDTYGGKAHNDLIVTKGKGFRKEKTKKKRLNHHGGKLGNQVNSFKFPDDSDG